MSGIMRFLVVDMSNLVHRAKHSVSKYSGANTTVFDPFGDVVNQVNPDDTRIGFILTTVFTGLINAFNKFDADHCIATFDLRSWRRDYYKEYKANRRDRIKTPTEEHDENLIEIIIDEVKMFLQDFTNITVLESKGVEADDFVARWVQIHHESEFEHIIVSADSDFKQLVKDNVDLYNPMAHILYTTEGVFQQDGKKKRNDAVVVERYGQTWTQKLDKDGQPQKFDPEWELFEKCIRGDSSDNIKSAYPRVYKTKMMKAFYGSVEEYNNFINSTWGKDGEKHSVRELFERNRTLIDLSQQPENIKLVMDETILDALDRERARMIGAYFAKFCAKYKLLKLSKQADRYVEFLSKGYPG